MTTKKTPTIDAIEAKADQALAVGNGCHQQIADLNRALVSTLAKADDALKAGATALRSCTECETQIDRMDKRIDAARADLNTLAPDVKAITTGLLNAREDTAARLAYMDKRISYSVEKRQKEYAEQWTALNNQIGRVAADTKNDIAVLRAAVENLAKQVGKAQRAEPIAIMPRTHTCIVLFRGGCSAAKSGFKTVESALTWFAGYKSREHGRHGNGEQYTSIVVADLEE